ncbi:MAG: type pilus assembly protein PilC [Frankiales bacterium]|jgi:type IV pilus assembly protein PilC|nr:type pilus assembly protein PilC [Frankiales bacterium]
MSLPPFGRRAKGEPSAAPQQPAEDAGLLAYPAPVVGAYSQGIVYGTQPVAAAPAPVTAEGSFFDKRVKPKELMQFSRQLAAFVRAGIPILDGLALLQEDTPNPTMRRAIADMEDSLRRGDTLSSALERSPKVFSKAYRSMLRSAELTGNLDTVLERVAGYLERDVEARSKIKAASVYPAVIVVMSIGVVTLLVAYVLPKFTVFFNGFHTKLPLPTRMLIGSTSFLTQWWWALVAVSSAAAFGLAFAWRQPRSRYTIDRLILRTPVMGPLLRFAMVERFCRVLSSMLQAGVSLPEAMTVGAQAMNNLVVERALGEAREGIMRGEGLAGPLGRTALFPPAARQMLKVGEDTGSIDAQLEAAARYYEREVDDKLKRLTSLFEPAILIVMGVIVGFVAIALVSAMYGIFNAHGATK